MCTRTVLIDTATGRENATQGYCNSLHGFLIHIINIKESIIILRLWVIRDIFTMGVFCGQVDGLLPVYKYACATRSFCHSSFYLFCSVIIIIVILIETDRERVRESARAFGGWCTVVRLFLIVR